MDYRIEEDTMGKVKVPADRYWGAQTERSRRCFQSGRRMPAEIIRAFAYVKKAAALANVEIGVLSTEKADLICRVCDEILSGKLDGEFPLVVYQTGSGTHTNMNINEVIANRGNEIADKKLLHPNDDVNMSQSSNDTFPSAMAVAAVFAVEDRLLPVLDRVCISLDELGSRYARAVKPGRTHLQDAVPLTFGQEVSGWRSLLLYAKENVESALPGLTEIALGGTAVGTGLNAPEGFDELAAEKLSEFTGKTFRTAENKFRALSGKDQFVFAHGALKSLAADLMKIANDIRWLAGGPRNGLGEITIPANEPGSSIMPGKVNPTQTEAATMAAVRVMGNDTVVGVAASQGNFELNVYMPVIADAFIESVDLLAGTIASLDEKCISGIEANVEKMRAGAESSLMLATALNTHIGYASAAKVAKKAHAEGLTLREAGIELGLFTGDEYDEWVDVFAMTKAEPKE